MKLKRPCKIAIDIVITRVNGFMRIFAFMKESNASQRKYEDQSCLK
jgi:hypothetical protein